MKHIVIFQPSGRRAQAEDGANLLTIAREAGEEIRSLCGGSSVCGKCKVQIPEIREDLAPITIVEKNYLTKEELAAHYRLACEIQVYQDLIVSVPEESKEIKGLSLTAGSTRLFDLDPAVVKYYLELPSITGVGIKDDLSNIKAGLAEKYNFERELTIDPLILQTMQGKIRQQDGKITLTIWQNREIINIDPGFVPETYGVSLDVGTTTIAAYLCDLSTGDVLLEEGIMNPQVAYGEDVIGRISYAMTHEQGLQELQARILASINDLLQTMAGKIGITSEQIQEGLIVFNTPMHHILLGIDPQYLGQAPFMPALRMSVDLKARDVGIAINPAGNIHFPPVGAGFIGSDKLAVLLAEEPYQGQANKLIIDIGTNGEISFGNNQGLWATSCATGPALEGAQIRFGMRAAPGAIDKVKIDPITLKPQIEIIKESFPRKGKNTLAKGICGSGIIDVIAEMFKTGIIKGNGAFNQKLAHPHIRQDGEGNWEYLLVLAKDTAIGKDIVITQADVRAVQLAKAALYVGAKSLIKHGGHRKIDQIILAGAFGSFIDKENALVIGMFPDTDPGQIKVVGNAAGAGARLALLNKNKRLEAQKLVDDIQFVETALEEDFMYELAYAMDFPHARDEFPHIEHILARIPGKGNIQG